MGLIQHNAIIVTGWEIEGAHELAVEAFGSLVSPLVPGAASQTYSFLIAPDGSKEGWSTSDKYDRLRSQFKDQLESLADFHGYWVEVCFGENENDRVVDGSLERAIRRQALRSPGTLIDYTIEIERGNP